MDHTFNLRFMHGDVGDPEHLLIMAATFSKWVHVEAQISGVSFSAYLGVVPSFTATRSDPPSAHWESMRVPLTNRVLALDYLHDMVRAQMHYATGWQCCLPGKVVRALESDLDCQRPESWGKVFCSQAILLWLRRCALSGILDTGQDVNLLWEVHSMACPPCRLRQIASALFKTRPPPLLRGVGAGSDRASPGQASGSARDGREERVQRLRNMLRFSHPPQGASLWAAARCITEWIPPLTPLSCASDTVGGIATLPACMQRLLCSLQTVSTDLKTFRVVK